MRLTLSGFVIYMWIAYFKHTQQHLIKNEQTLLKVERAAFDWMYYRLDSN